jgi:hypothetical protein
MIYWHRPKSTATTGVRDAGELENHDQQCGNQFLQSPPGRGPGRSAASILVRPLVSRQLGPLPESGESNREAALGGPEAFPWRTLAGNHEMDADSEDKEPVGGKHRLADPCCLPEHRCSGYTGI